MSSKDREVESVAVQLDELLGRLRANVGALQEILTRPEPPHGGEADERLVPQ